MSARARIWALTALLPLAFGAAVGCAEVAGIEEPAPASCDNGVADKGEEGIDCAGPCAGFCPGVQCAADGDCSSGVCGNDGTCSAPSCNDTVWNGRETAVDCGGPECNGCGAGLACNKAGDCDSAVCGKDHMCTAPTCKDGIANGTESDIDCGGASSKCPRCGQGDACVSKSDCAAGLCIKLACFSP